MPQDETARGRDSSGGGAGDHGFLKVLKVPRTFERTSGVLLPYFRWRAQWLLKKEWGPKRCEPEVSTWGIPTIVIEKDLLSSLGSKKGEWKKGCFPSRRHELGPPGAELRPPLPTPACPQLVQSCKWAATPSLLIENVIPIS